MNNNLFKKIYKKIKQYDEIVIARHIGPDPDAIASQIALRDAIKLTFPKKKVFAVGNGVAKFKYYGTLDKINDKELNNPLLIILDVPNIERIDGVNYDIYKEVIKIDHHPFVDKTGEIELIDTTSSSTCQLIIELILSTNLKMNKHIAEDLFLGVVADSDRFLFSYTTSKTLKLIAYLMDNYNLDLKELYDKFYERPLNEVRFQAYIAENLMVTENGFAYIKLDHEKIKEFGVDNSSASNMINNFNFIKEIYAWAFSTLDEKSNIYKINIRSRGPIINEVAARHNGGGHIYSSGARIKTEEEVDELFEELDLVCKEFKEQN